VLRARSSPVLVNGDVTRHSPERGTTLDVDAGYTAPVATLYESRIRVVRVLRIPVEASVDFVSFVNPAGWGNDLPHLVDSIRNQAHAALVPSCALAAIVKRESDGCNVFQQGVSHDSPDCGYGYCQITFGANRQDPEHPSYTLDGRQYDLFDRDGNLFVAAKGFLAPAISDMLHLRDALGAARMPEEILYYAFAAYNAGSYRVSQTVRGGGNVDSITTDAYASATLALYRQAVTASEP